jgi:hypothetical protein
MVCVWVADAVLVCNSVRVVARARGRDAPSSCRAPTRKCAPFIGIQAPSLFIDIPPTSGISVRSNSGSQLMFRDPAQTILFEFIPIEIKMYRICNPIYTDVQYLIRSVLWQ